jgi:hypothetical protein
MMWLGIAIVSALMVTVHFGLNLPNAGKSATGDPSSSLGTPEKIGFGSVNTAPAEAKADVATQARVQAAYGNLPLYFIHNEGQVNSHVKFYEKGSGHTTFFTPEGVYLHLTQMSQSSPSAQAPRDAEGKTSRHIVNSTRIKLSALGANKDPKIIPEGIQDGRVNYIIGNDPTKWRKNIPTYQAVVYRDLYPGIDMRFHGDNRQLEYDLIVNPGIDPSQVQLAYEGVDGLRVTETGDLEVRVQGGTILQKKPVVYQDIEGKRVSVDGKFKVLDSHLLAYSFEVAAYNKNASLVIDPPLMYSTFLGGSLDDGTLGPYAGHPSALNLDIAVDSSGNAYVTGTTTSLDFPITGGPTYAAAGDGFVAKLNATGSSLLCATYFGGSGYDEGHAIALDSFGNAYVTGVTESADFPLTIGVVDTTFAFAEAHVSKFNSSCAPVYSTYLGGDLGGDWSHDIAVDGSGNAYVTGGTTSIDFPTTFGAYDESFNGPASGIDAYVVKLNATATALLYSSFLGGNADENGWGVFVDGSGKIYVVGETASTDLLTPGGYDSGYNGMIDGFMVKIDPAGGGVGDLLYSTYLGGVGDDIVTAVVADGAGRAYIAGRVTSIDFPTTAGAYDMVHNGGFQDEVLVKLNPSATGLASFVYSTFLGGSGDDDGHNLVVDGSGNIYTSGGTTSVDFPTTVDAISGTFGGVTDAYVVKLRPDGLGAADLKFATYLGGSADDRSHGVDVDALGNIYVTGRTSSPFPVTPGAYDTTYNGGPFDVFVTKIGVACDLPRLANVSTRGVVGTGDNVLIGGYIIAGNTPKTVLIRARGPSMGGAPFNVPDTLADPFVKLYSFASGTYIAQNDNWQTTNPQCDAPAVSCGTSAEITATGLDPCLPNPGQTTAPPGCAQESAILITLPPGNYGAVVSGVGETTGVGLVEVFETP